MKPRGKLPRPKHFRMPMPSKAELLRRKNVSIAEMSKAGWAARDFWAHGFTADELKANGYSARELKRAGYQIGQIMHAKFSVRDLLEAGYSRSRLTEVFVPLGVPYAPIGEFERLGFTPRQLLAMGSPVKQSGHEFKPNDMRKACERLGFTIENFKRLGVTARELLENGFGMVKIREVGYHAAEMHKAGIGAKQLKELGYPLNDFAKLYPAKELAQAGYVPYQLFLAGVSETELRKIGVTDKMLHQMKSSTKMR